MADGCCCTGGKKAGLAKTNVPLLCLVPIDEAGKLGPKPHQPRAGGHGSAPAAVKPQDGGCDDLVGGDNAVLFDNDYLKKHFKLPPRALYLDPFHRPLISFPLTQETRNFNMNKKQKTNQMILDGIIDPSAAVMAPSIFPFAKSTKATEKLAEDDEDEEIIYILQLPDWEFQCPIHNQTIRTPRFVWHTAKKNKGKKSSSSEQTTRKQGGGPMNRPKPWLLSRITDFDLLSQW